MEHGHSDSTSSLSETPDIANWFSSYVYESLPFTCLANESEIEVDGFPVGEPDKQNLGVSVSESKSPEKDNKSTREITDTNTYDSLPSEPPDIGNWFSSYVYESPILDTSDALQFSVPRDSECLKETETDKETAENERNIVSSAKVAQSESLLSEPPDVRNWFLSYEYQSPPLSEDTPDFSTSEKDELIIDESDTEDENITCIFRKTKSTPETIAPGSSALKDFKEIITADTAKKVSSDNAYADQPRSLVQEQQSASTEEVKQPSSFKLEPSFHEPKEKPCSYNPKPLSPSKNEASLHEVRPKQLHETISINSSRQRACTEDIFESTDDKENVAESGFVTMKKARFRESRDQCSMKKPMRGERSSNVELKKISKEEDKERRKKRRVLEEMSNQQFPGGEEMAGKWHCPQKTKGKLGPPMKQLRLDAWIHKV